MKYLNAYHHSTPRNWPPLGLPVTAFYALLRRINFPEERHILMSEATKERSLEFLLQPDKSHSWDMSLNPCLVKHSNWSFIPISPLVTLTPLQKAKTPRWLPPPPRHGVMAEAYEEVSWLPDPTQSFGGCHRDTKCEAEGCQRWAGLQEKFGRQWRV